MNNHVMKEKKMLFDFAIYCLQILAEKNNQKFTVCKNLLLYSEKSKFVFTSDFQMATAIKTKQSLEARFVQIFQEMT